MDWALPGWSKNIASSSRAAKRRSARSVGSLSLFVHDLRLYLIQTAEKGMAWLDLIADGRAGHGSLRNDRNAITELSAAVTKIGTYHWPRKITGPQRAFLEAVAEAFEVDLDPDRVEETLARLGTIARMVGATMSNTANPTMLSAGYKHNVIPVAPQLASTAGSCRAATMSSMTPSPI